MGEGGIPPTSFLESLLLKPWIKRIYEAKIGIFSVWCFVWGLLQAVLDAVASIFSPYIGKGRGTTAVAIEVFSCSYILLTLVWFYASVRLLIGFACDKQPHKDFFLQLAGFHFAATACFELIMGLSGWTWLYLVISIMNLGYYAIGKVKGK